MPRRPPLIAISHNLPRFRPARPNARWSTLPRCRIAEKPADLEPGVGFFDIGWDGCRWPMTEVVPISDFKFCGRRVSCGSWCSVHADQAIQPRQPRGRQPSGAATAELADVRPPQMKVSKKDVDARGKRGHDAGGPTSPSPDATPRSLPTPAAPLVLALERCGIKEARDLVTRMLAAPRLSDRVRIWITIEVKLHGAAIGQLRAIAWQFMNGSSRIEQRSS
jgi:hypothetical protein